MKEGTTMWFDPHHGKPAGVRFLWYKRDLKRE